MVSSNKIYCELIPKSKECYHVDFKKSSEFKKIYDRIEKVEIDLFHLGGRQWSVDPNGDKKSVEEAAADYLKRLGYRELDHSYLEAAALTCLVALIEPKSWTQVVEKGPLRILVTPKMYDEGYPLGERWQDTPPRLLPSDQKIINAHLADLKGDFSTRDVLVNVSKNVHPDDKREKLAFCSAMNVSIDALILPQRQKNILIDALAVYSKFLTKSNLTSNKVFGSVFHKLDSEKIYEDAIKTKIFKFIEILPTVKSLIDKRNIKIRNRSLWTSYRERVFENGKLSLADFEQSEMLEKVGLRCHGARWSSMFLNTEADFLDMCTTIFETLGAECIINYYVLDLWRFLRTGNRSGHSDLIMWDGASLGFFEVKSPNDKIQINQLDRFNSVMYPAGLNYKIVNVKQL